jgi:hypothetical protein
MKWAVVLLALLVPDLAVAQEVTPRRPSMVGYVEDSTIGTQLRFRFDLGSRADRPDRAEFFYAKCGCYRVFDPPFQDPDAPGPGPGAIYSVSYRQVYVQGDLAVSNRLGLFAEVSLRSVEPDKFVDFGVPPLAFESETGLGDTRVGAKVGLLQEEDRALTLLIRAGIPTGDAAKGLGNNNANIEPALLFARQMGPRWGIESQLGYFHPFGGSDPVPGTDADSFAGGMIYYGIGPSFDWWENERVRLSPVFEVVGWHVLGGNQTECGDGECSFHDADSNIVNAKVGARLARGAHHSFYLGFGLALTDASWYRSILRGEYRYRP